MTPLRTGKIPSRTPTICSPQFAALETPASIAEEHKKVFAILTADETVSLGAVEPLYCSFLCHIEYWSSFQLMYATEIRKLTQGTDG
jgi:hypothetical protein